MPPHDAFINQRTDAMIVRFKKDLDEIRERWSQGVIIIGDPDHMALWVIPADPMSEEAPKYTEILNSLKSRDEWACVADTIETATKARRNRSVPAPTFYRQTQDCHTSMYY